MNIKYLKNILDKAKECESDAVKVDIEEFASAVAWIENHETLPNSYADRLAEQSYQRGRRDAIDEFQKWYTDLMNNPPSAIVPYSLIFDKLEQMKGENDA